MKIYDCIIFIIKLIREFVFSLIKIATIKFALLGINPLTHCVLIFAIYHIYLCVSYIYIFKKLPTVYQTFSEQNIFVCFYVVESSIFNVILQK